MTACLTCCRQKSGHNAVDTGRTRAVTADFCRQQVRQAVIRWPFHLNKPVDADVLVGDFVVISDKLPFDELQALNQGEQATVFKGAVIRNNALYIADDDKITDKDVRINRFVEVGQGRA